MKKYSGYYDRWLAWADKFPEITAVPANDKHVALFMVSLLQTGASCHVVESVLYAVKWGHEMAGHVDPTGVLCHNMVEAAKRLAKPARVPKEPLTPEILEAILGETDQSSLLDVRRFVLLLVSYAGFLRFDEAVSLRKRDFEFFDVYMSIFIEHSKTDQYRDGRTLIVARTGSSICPVCNVENLLQISHPVSEDSFLFRALVRCHDPFKFRLGKLNRPLSYSTCRLDLIDMLKRVGVDPASYGLHSARSGGASWAANAGVPDRLFKRHERWVSERAKDSYVKDNLLSLLSVTQNIGL